ncbi:MAG: WYL domain-containing protein [Defluviitaleaceae bacterium]|nr:WYL domain-containing protein [Defluviitaleaceae bacterium]
MDNFIDFPKKTKFLMIFDLLKEHSSKNNPLKNKKLREMLKTKYGLSLGRHTLTEDLRYLQDFLEHSNIGFELHNDTQDRVKNGEISEMSIGWYLDRDLSDGEVQLLIDALLFSKFKMSNRNYTALVTNLKNLLGHNALRVKALNSDEHRDIEKRMRPQPLTVEKINEAIAKGLRLSFQFMYYGADKKPKIIMNADSTPRLYKVTPYEIVVTNGRYYLICAHENSEQFHHYRIDYIHNAEIETAAARPITDIIGDGKRFDLTRYMDEHIYMYGGESVTAAFRCDKRENKHIIGHIIDWFGYGDGVRFSDETEDFVTAAVTANEKALSYWALQYGACVEVLKPTSLRLKVRENVEKMWAKYQ